MAEVKWIKLCTDVFDDEKILLIETLPEADSIIVIWFKLLCLAGKQNNSGVFIMNNRIAYNEKMLATIFRRKESTVELALNTFEQFGMIERIDGVVTIPNWCKHQNLDSIEAKRNYQKEYMRGYREKQKQLADGKTNCKTNCKTNSKSNVSSIDKNRVEEDKEEDKEDKNNIGSKPKRFTPPSLEDVQAYCFERNNNVDAERFIDYYQSNGWMVGRNKMKDWKSAVRTWEKNNYSNQPKKQTEMNGFMGDLQRMYNEEE